MHFISKFISKKKILGHITVYKYVFLKIYEGKSVLNTIFILFHVTSHPFSLTTTPYATFAWAMISGKEYINGNVPSMHHLKKFTCALSYFPHLSLGLHMLFFFFLPFTFFYCYIASHPSSHKFLVTVALLFKGLTAM